jgi:hypothetical protein
VVLYCVVSVVLYCVVFVVLYCTPPQTGTQGTQVHVTVHSCLSFHVPTRTKTLPENGT